ncbi:MAG: hypothetical protein IJS80_02735 [Lachnospiraceae bacterium]|nr:hypothetical protein [Lachnospiraceae bacterium]
MGFLDYFHYQNFLLLVMLGGGLAALVGCIISTVAHFNDEGYYIGISLVNAIGIVGALAGFFLYIGLSFDFFGKGGSFLFYFVIMCILLSVAYLMLYLGLVLSHKKLREFIIYGASHLVITFLVTFILGRFNVHMVWPG